MYISLFFLNYKKKKKKTKKERKAEIKGEQVFEEKTERCPDLTPPL